MVLLGTAVYDVGGNNNGRVDPGETVDLTAIFKNIGGYNFTNLNTTLHGTDVYITINDNTGYFGELLVDSTGENIGDPYIITAGASAPQGHMASFHIITTDGSFIDTFYFDVVIGTFHYLVWNPDPTPTSGQRIDSLLSVLGYSGHHYTSLPATDLGVYQAILGCCGVYPSRYLVEPSGPEATALEDYINAGGRVYLEGSAVWYIDPYFFGAHDFCDLFGINGISYSYQDMGPIAGETSTFTQGMSFNYAGDNQYMDHINPQGTGFLIFHDTNNGYNCGVANDAAIYQTVGTSFELEGLVDGSGVSTRKTLLDSIMHFFGINLIGIEENTRFDIKTANLNIHPNPFNQTTNIIFSTIANSITTLVIYDAAGRAVKSHCWRPNRTVDQITWDGKDDRENRLSAGIYFVRVQTEMNEQWGKIILFD
ncbi:MAG: T9SS type A sorting domain-containing protein [bacterium]